MDLYDFTVKDIKGNEQRLDQYRGKVLLIVNTATECGFTPQYENLQNLYDKYHQDGFEILDFPCNQFGHQAPGTEQEIASFCTVRFGVTFPQFSKIDVNGENQSPLFAYLKQQQGFKGFDTTTQADRFMDEMMSRADPDYAKKSDIKWNFTKFLIDKEGHVVNRFEPMEALSVVEDNVVLCLKG
ncbi:MAG: glutathione peroxidase [Alphaproteobacteria bacterium]|nr:glutathione peroxidase [Alphaproteobacteria bacterium]